MTLANPATTPLATSKTAALTRILDMVPKGYVHYTAGECPAGKLEALARKFHDRYGIGCSPAQRLTRKQKGLANAVLVLYLPPGTAAESDDATASVRNASLDSVLDSSLDALEVADKAPLEPPKVSWLLLATEGAGPVHEQEHLRSVRDSRRLVFLGYELVRYAQRGKTSWTWRRTKEAMAEQYALLASQLNAHQMGTVAQTLLRISRQPGFSGVRKQSWELCQFARSRGYTGELPYLYFVEKVAQGERLVL